MNAPHRQMKASPSKQRLRLWLNLLRATRKVEAALREEMRQAYGSTLPRFDVRSALDLSRDGLLLSELSQRRMVSNGNVTGIIERLVVDGLVERLPVPGDKRATRVRLTAEGARAFAEMAAEHEGWVDQLLAEIDAEEAQFMIDALTRIRREGDDDKRGAGR